MNTKDIILHLIKEELRNKRLMFSLEDLGIDCSFYTLDISNTILSLAGFREVTDPMYEWYFGLVSKALEGITFRNLEQSLQNWPMVIYNELIKKKNEKTE